MTLAELGKPQWQIAVTLDALVEHLDMAGAVHRFDGERAAIDGFRGEHVIAERIPVTRTLPQRARHHFGRVDFLVPGLDVALPRVGDQRLEHGPAVGVPEDGARRLFLEVEQVHDLAEAPVIAFLGLLEHVQVLAQRLVVGPRRSIDTLQHLVIGIAAPVGARHVRQLERFAQLAR